MNQDAPTPIGAAEQPGSDSGLSPASLVETLEARLEAEPKPERLPDHLPLSGIKLLPELFQPRGMAEHHIHELSSSVKAGRVLDPVKVIQVGAEPYLVDGHHRIKAYRRAGHTAPVPVVYFPGTVEDAVLEAGRENSKAKLTMTNQERQDYAWRLVRMGTYTAKRINEASSVSLRQIANMRSALKGLGLQGQSVESWWKARKLAEKKANQEITGDELEERLEAQAADYANRMAKAFSTKLATNPAMAARTLNIYFGRHLPELVEALDEYLPDGSLSGEDEEPDF